jgi:hypothetical protein
MTKLIGNIIIIIIVMLDMKTISELKCKDNIVFIDVLKYIFFITFIRLKLILISYLQIPLNLVFVHLYHRINTTSYQKKE